MSYTPEISNSKPITYYENREKETKVRSAKYERFLKSFEKLTDDFARDAKVEIAARNDPEKEEQLAALDQLTEFVYRKCGESTPK